MDHGTIGLSYDDQLTTFVIRTVVWLVVVAACAVAVRRPWAWLGLPGGILGLGVAATYLADAVKARSDISKPSAQVFDDDYDFPGFLYDHARLADLLTFAETASLALVAAALVTGAVLSRRARRD